MKQIRSHDGPSLSARAIFALALGIAVLAGVTAGAQAPFRVNKNLYSETAKPAADIAAAVAAGRNDHKRILLDFGGTGAATARCSTTTITSSPLPIY